MIDDAHQDRILRRILEQHKEEQQQQQRHHYPYHQSSDFDLAAAYRYDSLMDVADSASLPDFLEHQQRLDDFDDLISMVATTSTPQPPPEKKTEQTSLVEKQHNSGLNDA
jgi:hypothetical protein